MRRRIAAGLSIVAVALVAGCGGGLSSEEYASEVDAVCTDSAKFFQGLPARAAEEELDSDAIRELADEKAAEAQASLEELEPPDELADEHERLLALGEQDPPEVTDDDVVAYFEEFRDAYAAIGADECVAIQDDSIAQISDVADDAPIP